MDQCRENKRMLLFIVWVTLFVDNMLVSTVVPIVPQHLLALANENRGVEYMATMAIATTLSPPLINSSASPSPLAAAANNNNRSTITALLSTDAIELQNQRKHEAISNENIYVGIIFGSKMVAQLITNPLNFENCCENVSTQLHEYRSMCFRFVCLMFVVFSVGTLVNKVGYSMLMFAGIVIVFASTLLFAFGTSFSMLLAARCIQGIGSACTSTTGFGMLSKAYQDDKQRGIAMGIAMGGLALGLLLGAPYGGLLFAWSGAKVLPFVLLAGVAFVCALLQLVVLRPCIDRSAQNVEQSAKCLLRDPYVLAPTAALAVSNLGWGILESSMSLWMMEKWKAGSFEQGYAFMPASISYFIGTNVSGVISYKIGRWLYSLVAFLILSSSFIAVPFATSVVGLIAPLFCAGFATGMVDASMFSLIGRIADTRHAAHYGSIYALGDAAICAAIALGAFISGPLVRFIGFTRMMYVLALTIFAYAPTMLFLRKIPSASLSDERNNNKNIVHPSSLANSSTSKETSA